MHTIKNLELGTLTIENNVIAKISGIAAMESYGIVGMASKNAADGIFELLKFDYISKGVKVYNEENKLRVELHVILEYGVNISVVCDNIIERVRFNVENMTGIQLDEVKVFVEGIRVEKPSKGEAF